MRILVHEWFSGGGLAGRPVPPALATEGRAMRDALLADLGRLPEHRVAATVDPRFPLPAPSKVRGVPLRAEDPAALRDALRNADAVWLIAPETDDCLARLAEQVESVGCILLGPSAAAVRRASDKAGLARLLADAGIPVPTTRSLRAAEDPAPVAEALGYPVVVKPARGAGCEGVGLARGPAPLARAVRAARAVSPGAPVLLQRWVPGAAASVALVSDGKNAVPLAVSAQRVRIGPRFVYGGGWAPLRHPLAGRAAERAVEACRIVGDLRGYVGVDVVLIEHEAVIIEINPRLTTAYPGLRAALDANPAALALDACRGRLPTVRPAVRRHVRFTAAGRVESAG